MRVDEATALPRPHDKAGARVRASRRRSGGLKMRPLVPEKTGCFTECCKALSGVGRGALISALDQCSNSAQQAILPPQPPQLVLHHAELAITSDLSIFAAL